MHPVMLVANSGAGSAAEAAVDEARSVLAGHTAVEVVWTDQPRDLDAVIHRLDGRVMVLAGGDGSVSAAANRVLEMGCGTDVQLGLIPLGTGNDLARALRIPREPALAARALLDAEPVEVDVLALGDRYAVNAVHIGVGADAARRAASLKTALGALAYPIGALGAGLRVRRLDLLMAVDHEPSRRVRPLMVAMMNGLTVGGGTRMSPHQHVADGRMGLSVIDPPTPARRAGLALDMVRDRHLGRSDVRHRSCTRVEIRSDGALLVNVDGEVSEVAGSLTVEVVPAALRLLVGRSA